MARKSNKSKSNKSKKNRKVNWKRILVTLLIIGAVVLALKLYENYKAKKEAESQALAQQQSEIVAETVDKNSSGNGGANSSGSAGKAVSDGDFVSDGESVADGDSVSDGAGSNDPSLKSEGESKSEGVNNKTIPQMSLSQGGEKKANSNVSPCDLGHPEDSPLFFGNPSDAVFDVASEDNYLMVKDNYTLSYNNKTLCPNWVSWHLDMDDIGDADRSDKFVADKELPDQWHGVTKADYQFNAYGFDRGHVCPSADRTYSKAANEETFLMTNMMPQSSDNNRVVWVALEKYQREIVNGGNEVYIIAGPAGTGGESDKGYFEYISITQDDGSELKINVPEYTWKILMVLPEGDGDLNRISEDTEVFAVCVPNKKGINSDLSWMKYLCSVNDLENLTGYDFFEVLDDDLEDILESRTMVPEDFQ